VLSPGKSKERFSLAQCSWKYSHLARTRTRELQDRKQHTSQIINRHHDWDQNIKWYEKVAVYQCGIRILKCTRISPGTRRRRKMGT
jgi:hypothetical protein